MDHSSDPSPPVQTDPPERLLTERQVHEVTGVPIRTLQWWRAEGRGPTWRRLGQRLIRYPERDLAAWIEHGEANR